MYVIVNELPWLHLWSSFLSYLSIRFGKVIIIELLLSGVKVDVQRNLVHARQLLL